MKFKDMVLKKDHTTSWVKDILFLLFKFFKYEYGIPAPTMKKVSLNFF